MPCRRCQSVLDERYDHRYKVRDLPLIFKIENFRRAIGGRDR